MSSNKGSGALLRADYSVPRQYRRGGSLPDLIRAPHQDGHSGCELARPTGEKLQCELAARLYVFVFLLPEQRSQQHGVLAASVQQPWLAPLPVAVVLALAGRLRLAFGLVHTAPASPGPLEPARHEKSRSAQEPAGQVAELGAGCGCPGGKAPP